MEETAVAATTSWNNIVPIDWGTVDVTLPDPPRQKFVGWPANGWKGVFNKRISQLTKLQRGWDGYDALPLSSEVIIFAWEMLGAICTPKSPPPNIVPGVGGDLQVEWHTNFESVELHVIAVNRVHAWRRLNATGLEEEVDLSSFFDEVAPWIEDLPKVVDDAAVATGS